MEAPTIDGHDLAPGDELGRGAIPACCDEEMDPEYGHLEWFKCGTCGTTLLVEGNGLVGDIQ
jgi:hypothetical protein